MSAFEGKLYEMINVSHSKDASPDMKWYFMGYRDALREAINVYKETTTSED